MEIKLNDKDKKELFDATMRFLKDENPMSFGRNRPTRLEEMYQTEIKKQLKEMFTEIVKQLFDVEFKTKLQEIGNGMVKEFMELKTDTIVNSIIGAFSLEY